MKVKNFPPGSTFTLDGTDYYVGATGNRGEQTIFLLVNRTIKQQVDLDPDADATDRKAA